jgi:hypothetical protein
MSNRAKLDHDELRAALAAVPEDVAWLERGATRLGMPSPGDWTAVPGLLIAAKVMAVDLLAAGFVGQTIDDNNPSLGRYTEETAYAAAERLLFCHGTQPATPPRNVSRTRAAWLRAVKH